MVRRRARDSRKRIDLTGKTLVFTIEYRATYEDANIEEQMEHLREYGGAEIIKTEILE